MVKIVSFEFQFRNDGLKIGDLLLLTFDVPFFGAYLRCDLVQTVLVLKFLLFDIFHDLEF